MAKATQNSEPELTQTQLDTLKTRGHLSDKEIHEVLGESTGSIYALHYQKHNKIQR
jgi:hypothetical protein